VTSGQEPPARLDKLFARGFQHVSEIAGPPLG
jgi:hypothetical protein